jgi:hypothetical protein
VKGGVPTEGKLYELGIGWANREIGRSS